MRIAKTIYPAVGTLLIGMGTLFFFSQDSKVDNEKILIKPSAKSVLFPKTAGPIAPLLDKTYANPKYRFSFRYPEGFNVSGFAEGEDDYTVLVQKPGARESFQIFVSAFDEPGPVTPERIKKDLPDMVIEDPKEVLIGSDKKLRALIFLSSRPSFGKVREVWFVYPVRSRPPEATADPLADRTSNGVSGYLFQITTYEGLDNLIGPALETLKFQDN